IVARKALFARLADSASTLASSSSFVRCSTRSSSSSRILFNANVELKKILEELEERVEQRTKELLDAKVEAESASRAKSAFLATMSHEIRTPLSSILGFATLLRDQGDSESRQLCDDWLNTIIRSGTHLQALIEDILDLAKIDAERLQMNIVRCPVHALVEEVASLLRVRAIEKGISLQTRYKGKLPESLLTDPTRLRQVLVNVVGNAIKFTDRGSVNVEASFVSAEEPRLRFTVKDTGIGIAADEQAKIFDAFVQADQSDRRKYQGSGLGLAISRKLSQALGGDISVESTLGQGTTFFVEVGTGSLKGVPMISGRGIDRSQRREAGKRSNKWTGSSLDCDVLVVDDAEDNRVYFEFILRKADARVTIAKNGQEALDLVDGQEFQAIVMDMQMPTLDGYETTRRLREQGNQIPVIAVTANAMKEDEQRCIEAGCTAYLSKPCHPADLIDTIASFLPKDEPEPSNDFWDDSEAELIDGLRDRFLSNLARRVKEIEHSLSNSSRVETLAHKLRGSADLLGFEDLGRILSKLEHSARDDAADLPELIQEFVEASEACLDSQTG
ncbi:MAG: ATP-binding protein, partial [Planctomycetota bacterium]